MKKMLTLAVVLTLAFAGSAFAGSGSITDTGVTIGGSIFKTSKNVTITYNVGPTSYGAASKHLNGTTGYTTTNLDSTLTPVASPAGTASITAPTS
jgi:hypothetical protein